MCGPTAAQSSGLAAQQSLQQQLQTEATAAYGDDAGIMQQLSAAYAPIVAAGPNQEGYSPQEEQTLRTQADESTATDYKQAKEATDESLSAEGGGNTEVPSGTKDAIDAGIAEKGAQQRSSEQLGITDADYQQGYQEFSDATGGLLKTSQILSPTGLADVSESAATGADTEANTIAEQANSWEAPVLGAVGAIGGGFAGDFSFGSKPTPAP